MQIVQVPHPALRKKAQPVTHVDQKLISLIKDLGTTLDLKQNPPGVGLAAPQVDRSRQLFATKLPPGLSGDRPDSMDEAIIRVFINPRINKHSPDQTFGPDDDEPTLEGCLSIPGLYGPVPRWQWIEMEFQMLEGEKLVEKSEKFDWFAARVMQHELDHLHGILFTDYSLQYDLPVYQEDPTTEKMHRVKQSILEAF